MENTNTFFEGLVEEVWTSHFDSVTYVRIVTTDEPQDILDVPLDRLPYDNDWWFDKTGQTVKVAYCVTIGEKDD